MGWEDFYKDFHDWLKTDEKINAMWLAEKKTWRTAKTYSALVGKKADELFQKHFGKAFENLTAEQLAELGANLAKAVKQGYSATAYYTKQIMQDTLKAAGTGLKAIEPKLDESRLVHLSEKIIEGKTELIAKDTFQNVAYAAVSDTIEANSRFDSRAGLQTMLVRDAGGGCCAWCESLAGIFEYGKQPDDFFAVHKDCTCVIEYHVNKTHTRITYKQDEKGNLRKNTVNI